MSQVARMLTPSIFNLRRLSQWIARTLVLTFITKSRNNELASFVQKTLPYRAFLRNQIRTNFRVPTVPSALTMPRVLSALTVPRVPKVPIALTVPTFLRVPTFPAVPTAPTAPNSTASTPSGGSLYWFS